jgi:hypothetical protein
MAAGKAGIEQHSVARLPAAGGRTYHFDLARAIGADHMGKGRPGIGEAAGHPEVEPIEGGAANPDQYLVWRADRRSRHVLDPKAIQSAGAGERKR